MDVFLHRSQEVETNSLPAGSAPDIPVAEARGLTARFDNRYADEWLDNLEAFMKGETPPPADDADIAHVATRLASALAPIREIAQTRQRVSQRSPSLVHARYSKLLEKPRRRLARSPLLIAALLLLTLVTGVISTG